MDADCGSDLGDRKILFGDAALPHIAVLLDTASPDIHIVEGGT